MKCQAGSAAIGATSLLIPTLLGFDGPIVGLVQADLHGKATSRTYARAMLADQCRGHAAGGDLVAVEKEGTDEKGEAKKQNRGPQNKSHRLYPPDKVNLPADEVVEHQSGIPTPRAGSRKRRSARRRKTSSGD